MTMNLSRALSLLLYGLFSGNVMSESLTVSGFGTVAYSYENEDDLSFLRDLSHQSEPDNNGQWLSDSRLGLQLDYVFNQQWRATVQAVAKHSASDELSDMLTLGFIAYRPSDVLELRAGRFGLDAFWATTTRDIDYGHIWIRPPTEVYGWISLQALDGIDLTYTLAPGESDWHLGAQYGVVRTTYDPTSGDAVESTGTETMGISIKYVSGDWRARAAILRVGNFDIERNTQTESVRSALSSVASLGGAIGVEADQYNQLLVVENEEFYYSQVGGEYFDGRWKILSEVVSIASKSNNPALPSGIGGYVNLAYYWKQWTPYTIASTFRPDVDALTASNDWSGLGLDTLQSSVISGLNSTRVDQSTIALGIRWDLAKNLAVKAQADFISIAENGYGLWVSGNAKQSSSSSVQLYTLSMNFIF
ncbi:hypothetical protein EK599_00175 [Vibrio sp. T187]|uniref:hypothetical protein n=1 Tax=Vibrio TaxID=662 RepID=UPI0010CA0807|nr:MULTISPECIES: hypothetical protein [Vibrio]MBW3694098.1 hypothetical protein [Vibrio sp. T187]